MCRGESAAQVQVGGVGGNQAAESLDRRLSVAAGQVRGDSV
jgi:hypothetical protein